MLTGFQITPDGMVYVRNEGAIYADTLVNFEADYGAPAPSLISGSIQMLYEPGKRCFYADADGVIGGEELPWAPGDAIVAACTDLLAAKTAREYVEPEEPAEPEFGSVSPSHVASILKVTVEDGDIAAVEGAFNTIGAFYDDVGLYTIYFINEQPDTNYFALASGATLREVDKQVDYLTVEALDANGSRYDPPCFGVNFYRI